MPYWSTRTPHDTIAAMSRRQRRPWRRLVGVAACCAGCADCDFEDVPVDTPGPAVAIEVRPATLLVALPTPMGTRVVPATARVVDAEGRLVSEVALVWESTQPSVATVSWTGSGRTALLTARKATPPGTPAPVLVSAPGEPALGSATLELIVAVSPSGDLVRADHADGDPFSRALLCGMSGATLVHGAAAFADAGTVGPFSSGSIATCPEGGAVILPLSRSGTVFAPSVWTAGADAVDARASNPAIPAPRVVPIHLWLDPAPPGLSVAQLRANALEEVALANEILWSNTAGIQVVVQADAQLVSGFPERCDPVQTAVPGPTPALTANRLNVYYARGLTGSAGLFCQPNVILINLATRFSTTLAHELGHAFGLVVPEPTAALQQARQYWGHTNRIEGFRPDNIMWGGVSDASSDPRRWFSMGQLYRMHEETRSWLVRGGITVPPGRTCSCKPYESGTCPALGADVPGAGWVPAPAPALPAGVCP